MLIWRIDQLHDLSFYYAPKDIGPPGKQKQNLISQQCVASHLLLFAATWKSVNKGAAPQLCLGIGNEAHEGVVGGGALGRVTSGRVNDVGGARRMRSPGPLAAASCQQAQITRAAPHGMQGTTVSITPRHDDEVKIAPVNFGGQRTMLSAALLAFFVASGLVAPAANAALPDLYSGERSLFVFGLGRPPTPRAPPCQLCPLVHTAFIQKV